MTPERVAALTDTTVLCAHCEHEIAGCPECGKAEWRIVPEAFPSASTTTESEKRLRELTSWSGDALALRIIQLESAQETPVPAEQTEEQ